MNKKQFRMMVFILTLIMICSLGILTACNNQDLPNGSEGNGSDPVDGDDSLSSIPFDSMELPEVIARINGQEIGRTQFLKDYRQMRVLYEIAGVDTSSSEVISFMNEAIVSDMITTTLMEQEANLRGIIIDNSRVQAEYEKSIALFPTEEEFYDMLTELGIEEDAFKEKLRRQLKVSDLMKAWVDEVEDLTDGTVLSDEDKETMYAIIDAQLGGAASYEEIEATAEEMLEYNKVQIIIGEKIQRLIDDSEVEFFI